MRLRYLATAVLLSINIAARADTVTFSLTNSNGSVTSSGGNVTFDATVFAPASNGAAVFLNGDSFSIAAPIHLNDSDFFANFPLSLAPGHGFTGDLFVLTAPSGLTVGTTYTGTLTLLGGANGSASRALGTVNFDLNVTSPSTVTTTPEPSSFVLLGTGLLGLAGFARRRLS